MMTSRTNRGRWRLASSLALILAAGAVGMDAQDPEKSIFVSALDESGPGRKISLWGFGLMVRCIRDFTSDAAVLERDAARLFPRSQAGSAPLDAVHDTSEPKKINDAPLRSRAQVWNVTVQTGNARQQDFVLSTLVRNAGGLREFILPDSAIETHMRRYAAALSAQDEVTYRRPPGPAHIVQTGIRRDGVKLVTGILAPQ